MQRRTQEERRKEGKEDGRKLRNLTTPTQVVGKNNCKTALKKELKIKLKKEPKRNLNGI